MEKYPWRMVAAFAVLFVLVTLVNFYVFNRMTTLLGFDMFWLSLAYAVILTSLLIAGFLVWTSSVRAFKVLFVTVTTIYALEFSAIFGLLIFEILDLFVVVPRLYFGLAILIFVMLLAIVSAANAWTFTVRKIKLNFPVKLKAVHLSDLHIGTVHDEKYLAKVVAAVNTLEPDLIFITGDITSGAPLPETGLFDALGRLKARTFMATGNHEFYEGVDVIQKLLANTKVELLRDQRVQMTGYSVFGLDYSQEQGMTSARKIEIGGTEPVILLSHVPTLPRLPKGSVVLSGHYHAGQIFPFNFLGRLFLKYFKGIYEENGVTLHVSPGTGTWGPPMRFGSRNEITLIELG